MLSISPPPSYDSGSQAAHEPSSTMYSQHGGHHHSTHHHHAADTSASLTPQSSFDSVQHHSGGPWSQDLHYGGTNGTANAYANGASHGLYGSGGYYSSSALPASHQSAGVGSAYSYPVQAHQAQGATMAQSMYGSHNGTANGTSTGSAHHSGSSTPTSQNAYHHHHPHSMGGSLLPSPQGYPSHHQQGNYYGGASNVMSPSYTSAPQYSAQLPLAGRHRVTTTLWEDEGTLCFQVDARGVCVARRHDNNMINGTKLLNVCGMSRGKRDGILKNEKERIVVKVGAMHLKGVWITFQRGKQLAEQNGILDVLYPLFETNIQSFLYHPDNYPRTAAVMAAAQERHAQRSRAPMGDSPTGYPRSTSQSSLPGMPGQNPPPLMRSNTTPNGPAAPGVASYGQHNGYSSAPTHSPTTHMPATMQASPHAMTSAGIPPRPSSVDRRHSIPLNEQQQSPYPSNGVPKQQRTPSNFKRGLDDGATEGGHSFAP